MTFLPASLTPDIMKSVMQRQAVIGQKRSYDQIKLFLFYHFGWLLKGSLKMGPVAIPGAKSSVFSGADLLL